ncbi:MFS transporter [Psychromicrobium xiongbiense]|uniref:MFS transporter n=1 Tax=Psychromicrobium xiongbiense TaxID=3051184 RepID=UPI002552467E|nr:MFS transporter [Psychromicrobium sp. YIM S02556]
MPTSHETDPPKAPRSAVRRVVIATSIGTVIEYFDFALYGAATALVFGPLFFPNADPVISTMASFGVFAAAFIVRPIGGIIASNIGDRIGRKPILIATITLMGLATVLTGLLPTYETIGAWAPILLILTRILQGLGAGAEYAGAATAVSEYAPRKHLAFLTSFGQAAQGIALASATGLFALLALLPKEVLHAWAWRIPFLASAVIFVIAIYIRRHIEETPEFEQGRNIEAAAEKADKKVSRVPVLLALRQVPGRVLAGLLCGSGINVAGYLINTFSISYVVNTLKLSPVIGTVAVVCGTGLAFFTIPLFGFVADRIGVAKVYVGSAIAMAAYVFALFALLQTREPGLVILAVTLGYGVVQAGALACQAAFMTDLFPTHYRFSGIAIGRELNVAILGGTTPLIATALVASSGGSPVLVIAFVIAVQVLTVIGVIWGTVLRGRKTHEELTAETYSIPVITVDLANQHAVGNSKGSKN